MESTRSHPVARYLGAVAAWAIAGVAVAQSQFGHQIPLKLPKGANGMQPELALVYDPNGGNGIAGVGWHLTGLSTIRRIPYLSGFAHSQLGALVELADGSYRSKKESFVKLTPSGSCPASESGQPCSWMAQDRSGTKFHYGTTADSVVMSGYYVKMWALAKVEDLFGNSFEVTYIADSGRLYPSVITYTKGPGITRYRAVEFSYESRGDVEQDFYLGVMTKRLTQVVVKSNGPLLRRYVLTYGEYGSATRRSHLTSVQEFGDGSRAVNSFAPQTFSWQQGGTNFYQQRWTTQAGDWVGGTDWQQQSSFLPGDFDGDGKADIAYAFAQNVGSILPSWLLSFDVYPSSGQRNRWLTGTISTTSCTDPSQCMRYLPGDFNADGKSDVAVAFADSGAISIDVYVSQGSSFVSQRWATRGGTWDAAHSEFFAGDLDGDGRTDIAQVYRDAYGQISGRYFLANGGIFAYSEWFSRLDTWSCGDGWRGCMTFLSGDFDGNGTMDVAFAKNYFDMIQIGVLGNSGVRYSPQSGLRPWRCGTDWYQCATFLTGDFNGDGQTDIAYAYNSSGMIAIDAYLANAAWFMPQTWETSQSAWKCGTTWYQCAAFMPGDFNGDGKTDIAYGYSMSGRRMIDVHSANGTSFVRNEWASGQGTWVGGRDWARYSTFVLGDVDGDGKTDVAYAFNDGGKISIDSHSVHGAAPDLITRVDNGVGGTINVEYAPSPQVPGAIDRTSTNPGIPFVGAQQLVTRIVTTDGRGGTYTTGFTYHDARLMPGDLPERRYLGFEWVKQEDWQTGQYTLTFYDQRPGLEASIAKVQAWSGADELISEEIHTYELVYPNPGTELVRSTRDVVKGYENGVFAFYQKTATTAFDEYSNPTVKVQSAESCNSDEDLPPLCPMPVVTAETTFVNDAASWILGRVSEIRTTSGYEVLGHMRNVWTGNTITEKHENLDTTSSWVVTTMTYDANGNVETVTEPPNADGIVRTTTTEYDADFRTYPVRVTNALGHVTRRTYAPTDSVNRGVDGLVWTVTDVNDQTATTVYDALARKESETRPDGGMTQYQYSAPGELPAWNRIITSVDGPRSITTTEYLDGTGFVYSTETTGDDGRTICQEHLKDGAGRSSVTYAPHYCGDLAVAWTTTTYDPAGRVSTVVTIAAATPEDPVERAVTSTSLYGTNFTSIVDPNGNVTTRFFDARKQVTSIVDAAGQTTTYGYDALGRLTSVRLPNDDVSTITYDSLNRRTSIRDPQVGGAVVTFTYDALNRVLTRQAGNDPPAVFTYDGQGVAYGKGRLTKIEDASGTTNLSYTNMGQIYAAVKHVDGSSFSQTFLYDYAGRVKRMTYPDSSYAEYAYTDGGNLASLTLTSSSPTPQLIAAWTNYTATGKPRHVDFGNGVLTDYAYDAADHLMSVRTFRGPTEQLQDLAYAWFTEAAPGGLNLASITDRRADKVAQGINTDETQSYTYDPLYRITSAVGVWGTKAYAYDSIGNPTSFGSLVARTLSFNGQQVVSGTGLTAVQYDLAGNVTQKVLDGTTWEYGWTGDNRLASATKNGVVTAQMMYDAEGGRAKKIYSSGRGRRASTVTTIYVGKAYEKRTYTDGTPDRHTINLYANGALVATVTRSGAIVTALLDQNGWRSEIAAAGMYDGRTLRGATMKALHFTAAVLRHPRTFPAIGLCLFLVFAAWVLGSLAGALAGSESRRERPALVRLASAGLVLVFASAACSPSCGGAPLSSAQDTLLSGDTTNGPATGTHYFHRNHVNSTSVVTDSAGAVATRIVYVPFGEISQANSSGADAVTSKFTGQELDEELGLYNYGARYYDPAIGRFMSADTLVPSLSDSQSFNRYSYVRNNPIMYVDPSGHVFEFLGSGLAWLGDTLGQGLDWVAEYVLMPTARFVGKAVGYACEMTKAMVHDPMLALSIAVAMMSGNPILWLKATAAAIAATSLAMAAGVKEPIVLSVIAAAAGTLAVATSAIEFLRTGLSWAGTQGLNALMSGTPGKALSIINSIASSMVVNDLLGKSGWLPVPDGSGGWTLADPDGKGGRIEGLDSTYSQSTGDFTTTDTGSGYVLRRAQGYAGHGVLGLNNPEMQLEVDTGPLPQGDYRLSLGFNYPGKGNPTFRLTPIGGLALLQTGRSGFLIHAGSFIYFNSSAGCIVLPLSVRLFLQNYPSASGAGVLRVVR